MKRLLMLVLVFSSAALGCRRPGTDVFNLSEQTLQRLRASLDAVRERSKDSAPPDIDVSPLIGLNRIQIRDGLGKPTICDYPKLEPNEAMMAPCEHNGDWFYSFYRLPSGSVGGGPELLLQFGSNDVCTAAKWMMTQ